MNLELDKSEPARRPNEYKPRVAGAHLQTELIDGLVNGIEGLGSEGVLDNGRYRFHIIREGDFEFCFEDKNLAVG